MTKAHRLKGFIFKRYIVFIFTAYYPCGGFNDAELIGEEGYATFDTMPKVQKFLKTRKSDFEYFQVFDCQTRQVIQEDDWK